MTCRTKPGVARRSLLRGGGSLALILCALGCGQDPLQPPVDDTLVIELRWVRSYPEESRSDVETGLLWALSFLGSSLPREEPSPLSWRNDLVTLRLDRAGIDSSALGHWRSLLAAMKASEEYQTAGAIDVGRFVALTLCSPKHYYALTGVSPSYEEARARYSFDPKAAAIVESSVAFGNRLVEIGLGSAPGDIAFVAHEGTGSLPEGTFQITEHELLDLMPNGQLRFALYDAGGALKLAANDALTAAGKPSKCLWCHETELSRPFVGLTSVPGYYSLAEFEQQILEGNVTLLGARATLNSRVDFARTQDHTYAELLYLAFYEPSAERIASEWDLPVERAKEILSGLPTHAHAEFAFLGDELYERAQVDALAPYGVIEVSTDPREASAYEPNLLP